MNQHEKKQVCLTGKQDQMRRELESLLLELPRAACRSRDVAAVLEFIHAHAFDSGLNVGTVKQGCRIKDNNISTRFRIAVGLGIREYIEVLRLSFASRLLRGKRFEVYLIAMAVGYEHQETFCRAFRRHFGCPPSSLIESRRSVKS
ncbi:MAG TPA: AraC family transcriptional regulator [Thermoanaerobaculia bacterium]|nr:AraC family transcriptional regulator [Thermoanaerobaculia bacterium]